jgi:hypothetical protein
MVAFLLIICLEQIKENDTMAKEQLDNRVFEAARFSELTPAQQEVEAERIREAAQVNMAEVAKRLGAIEGAKVTSKINLLHGGGVTMSETLETNFAEQGRWLKGYPDSTSLYPQITVEKLKEEGTVDRWHECCTRIGPQSRKVSTDQDQKRMFAENPELLMNPPADFTFCPYNLTIEKDKQWIKPLAYNDFTDGKDPETIEQVGKILMDMLLENYLTLVKEAAKQKVADSDGRLDPKKRHHHLPMNQFENGLHGRKFRGDEDLLL